MLCINDSTSRFKISICSTNLLSKEYLDYVSIIVTNTDTRTDILDTRGNLEVDDNLVDELFNHLDSVIDRVIASAEHMMNYKSISENMLSKIRKINRKATKMTLVITKELIGVIFYHYQETILQTILYG